MISYKFITKDEFVPLFRKYRPEIFQDNNDIDINALYTESEKEKTAELDKMCTTQYRLYLTAWDDEKLVGWSWGFQKSGLEFYMCNSAIFPEYRRKGIYTELVKKVVSKAQEDGFQEITSKHHLDNNAVIIPKLKTGFIIQGFETNPRFGLLANLICYKSNTILNVHNQRTGFKKASNSAN
ncbi:MAG: GNAT family N-acetyltransferase [Bacteriovorax sp.]|nr:GNAT family N-acetyltransferase [Bacteriovorax sp.]